MQESGSPVVSSALTTIVKLHCNTSCPSFAPAALRPRREDAWLKRLRTGSFDAAGSFPCGNRGTKFCWNTNNQIATALIRNTFGVSSSRFGIVQGLHQHGNDRDSEVLLPLELTSKSKGLKFGDYLEERNFEVGNIVPDDIVCGCNMSAGLHVVGAEAGLIGEVRVQCNMSPQVHQINQKLLPRCLQIRNIHR